MKVRIHDTGADGRPVSCTGDYFTGSTFLEVVEGMMIHPFTLETEPVAYMRRILSSIGEDQGQLPDDPDEAAEAFLSLLVASGYAAFEPEGSSGKTEKEDKKED
jgi:hypothetical protein